MSIASAQSGVDMAPSMRSVDPATITARQQYSLLTGSVVPRPIALVTTLGESGPNAAPFSFFNVLGVDPPMVLFSVGMRGNADKDTVRNLKACPEMVIHIVDEANAERMNICSTPYPPGVNELEAAKFETVPADLVKPPRIRSCPIHFECELHQIIPFGSVPFNLVIARIVRMHFRDGLVDDKWHIDMRALDPIARATGPGMYARTTDLFSLPSLT